jgi:hypothetical protein
MSEPLRPLSIGELLDRTLSLYRRNFWLFVGVSSLGPVVGLIFSLVFAGSLRMNRSVVQSPGAAAGLLVTVGIGVVVMGFGYALAHAAAVKTVAAVYLDRSIRVLEAYRAVKKRFWRIIGVTLAVVIRVYGSMILAMLGVMLVVMVIAVGAMVVLRPVNPGVAGGIGVAVVIATLVAGVWVGAILFARYALSIQACVVEDLSRKQSLKRSVFLAKGSRSRILTVYAVFVVLGLAVGFGLQGLFRIVPKSLGPTFSLILNQLAALVAGMITAPLATIAMSLVYYDERVRKEAFDLQLMMEALDSAPPSVPMEPLPGTQPG